MLFCRPWKILAFFLLLIGNVSCIEVYGSVTTSKTIVLILLYRISIYIFLRMLMN